MLFGAVEVARRPRRPTRSAAPPPPAPLLALWGAGSLVGGVLAARARRRRATAPASRSLLGALAAGHLALGRAAGSLVALGAVLLVAGAAIAPDLRRRLRDGRAAAPAGTVTEAFAWLATAVGVGAALGAAAAGALADDAGPAAAFALAGRGRAVAAARDHAALRRAGRRPQPSLNGSRVAPVSSTQTVFVSVNSRMASRPFSRPMPLSPVPPKGTAGDTTR